MTPPRTGSASTTEPQFLVAGPVTDPHTVQPCIEQLRLRPDDPPLYLMVSPPFSLKWLQRIESMGGVPTTDKLKERLASTDSKQRRHLAWALVAEIEAAARDGSCAGIILTGLKHDTVVDEVPRRFTSRQSAVPA